MRTGGMRAREVYRWQAYDEAQLALELAPWLLYVRQGE